MSEDPIPPILKAMQEVADRCAKGWWREATKEEIRKDREYWGTMPWHPKGMRHPALRRRLKMKRYKP